MQWRPRRDDRITVRPVSPQDALQLQALVARLSPEARRNRFHHPLRGLSAQSCERLCQADTHDHVAFVMTVGAPAQEQVIAEARYVVDLDGAGNSAEFALVVDEGWQRRGLGALAMQLLLRSAQESGLRWLHGDVLATNLPMQRLMQHCGFVCVPDREDDGLLHAETVVTAAAGSMAPASRRGRWGAWGHATWQQEGALHA